MKAKKKTVIIAGIAFAVLLAGVFIWYNVAHSKLKFSIDESKVASIEIFNGNTGKEYKITEQSSIDHIVKNLNSITYTKDKSSKGYDGFSFATVIKDKDGKELESCIINYTNTIIYKDYFYRDNTSSIDYGYIEKLLKTLTPIAN